MLMECCYSLRRRSLRILTTLSIMCLWISLLLPGVSAEEEKLLLNIQQDTVGTSFVTLSWGLAPNVTIESYVLEYSFSGHTVRHSGANIDPGKRVATVYLHEPDHAYNVCVIATPDNETIELLSLEPNVELMGCVHVRSLRMIRVDSVLGLTLVLLFFVGTIMLAVVLWKVAHVRAMKQGEFRVAEVEDRNGGVGGDVEEKLILSKHDALSSREDA